MALLNNKQGFQASLAACYHSKRLHGKVNTMAIGDPYLNKVSGATTQELRTLISAIEKDDLDLLQSQLNIITNKNISDNMVSAIVPKKWHHVARQVMSTPLRTSISWRNVKALDMILNSKCHLSEEDLSLGLQKILSRVEDETELDIINHLMKHGATLDGPVHFTMAFEKLLLAQKLKLCERVIQITCESSTSNALHGLLYLSVTKRSARAIESNIDTDWNSFSKESMKIIMGTSNFSPKEFIKDTKVWLSLGGTPFQNIVHGLPLLIQTMSGCPLEALSWLLRRVCRYYALTSPEGKNRVRQLPALIKAAGIDLSKILSIACLSPRFLQDTGFKVAAIRQKKHLPSLMESCRVVVRNNIGRGNVYQAMVETNCIPTAIKDFVLLTDVQPLVWEVDE